jgi:hypothetical protein
MSARSASRLFAVAISVAVLVASCQATESGGETPRKTRPEVKNNPRGAKVTYFARAKAKRYDTVVETYMVVDTYLVVVSPTWAMNHTSLDEPFKAITQPRIQLSTEEHMSNLLSFMREKGFYSLRTVPAIDVAAIQRTMTSPKYIMLEEEGSTRVVSNEGLSPAQRKSFTDMESAICMAFNRAPSLHVEVQKQSALDAFREFLRAEEERAEREKKEQEGTRK